CGSGGLPIAEFSNSCLFDDILLHLQTVQVPQHLMCYLAKGKRTDFMPSSMPLIAIVGRPNVGKSTLFNRLIGQRRSIVTDEPGITRDRIYGTVSWNSCTYEIVDTGGLIPDEQTEIPIRIFEQAQIAIEASALILFVAD